MRKYTDTQYLAMQLVNRIIDFYDLKKKDRRRELVDIRRSLYHFLVVKHGLKYTAVAELFEKDHATIIHALKDYDMIKNDDEYLRNTIVINELISSELGHINKFKMTIEIDIQSRNIDDATEYAERLASIYQGRITEIKEL